MTDCNNNISLNDLPTCSNVDNDGYLIVQNTDSTCKVQIRDLILGVENFDFSAELLDLITQVEVLTSLVQSKSAEWDTCYTTTTTNSASWNQVDSLNLANVGNIVESTSAEWSSTTSLVFANSAQWDSAYIYMTDYSTQWNDALSIINLYPNYTETIGIVQTLSSQWNDAYDNNHAH